MTRIDMVKPSPTVIFFYFRFCRFEWRLGCSAVAKSVLWMGLDIRFVIRVILINMGQWVDLVTMIK